MPPVAMISVAEERITSLLLYEQHFYLMAGILCVIYLLRLITPVSTIIFSKKWNWVIPVLNFVLSMAGVFILKMTNATTNGMKIVIVVLISAVTSYGYELIKPLIQKLFGKFFGPEKTEEKTTT
jgi:hypothetical protein